MISIIKILKLHIWLISCKYDDNSCKSYFRKYFSNVNIFKKLCILGIFEKKNLIYIIENIREANQPSYRLYDFRPSNSGRLNPPRSQADKAKPNNLSTMLGKLQADWVKLNDLRQMLSQEGWPDRILNQLEWLNGLVWSIEALNRLK